METGRIHNVLEAIAKETPSARFIRPSDNEIELFELYDTLIKRGFETRARTLASRYLEIMKWRYEKYWREK